MGKNFPRPDGSGVVQGDSHALPDRGTQTGCQGDCSDYGANVAPSAINRLGSIKRSSQSDAPDARSGKHNQGS